MCRTNITAPPVPALLINNMAEGLEGRLAPEDAAERERRKKEWKQVSGAAIAGWKAMFVGGNRAAAPRRALGTDVFHRMFPMVLIVHHLCLRCCMSWSCWWSRRLQKMARRCPLST